MSLTLGKIAEIVGGELTGPKDLPILRPVPAGLSDPHGITFVTSDKYLKKLEENRVGAVLLPNELNIESIPSIHVDSPRLAFFKVLSIFDKDLSLDKGVHPTAIIHPTAKIHSTAYIGAYTIVGPDVSIGENTKVFPHSYIGDRCRIGSHNVLYPRVTLYQDTVVGSRVTIHSGAVIGGDGFGYQWNGKQHVRIPQVGNVEIGDDVSIGCNACIDRATCGSTQIGAGTKIDDLVLVGHNVHVGQHNILAGMTGVGGSAHLGDSVIVGGLTAISDHIHICSNVRIGGRSGIMQNIEEPGDYFGLPAAPIQQALRVLALGQRLPELLDRIKRLESEFQDICSRQNVEQDDVTINAK